MMALDFIPIKSMRVYACMYYLQLRYLITHRLLCGFQRPIHIYIHTDDGVGFHTNKKHAMYMYVCFTCN